MTANYGNLSTNRSVLQRSQNTRIHDLPSSNKRRGETKGTSWESLGISRRSKYHHFQLMDTPEWMKRERKAKISRVTT